MEMISLTDTSQPHCCSLAEEGTNGSVPEGSIGAIRHYPSQPVIWLDP